LWDYQRPEPSKIEAIGRLEFTPVVSSAKEIRVLSLLGTEITVPIDKHVDGLMVGNLNLIGKRANNAHFELRLRDLPHPEEYEKSELSNMLRKTCEGVLREAYNQREPNLSQLWTTLEKSNQLELAVARGLILNRLPYDLRNFRSAKKNEVLAKWQRNFNQLENILAEKLEITQTTDQVERDITEAKKSLAALMKSDRTVQESVLSGIRQKVEQNKYQISSIAFELLQNADDAVTELQSLMRGESAVAHPPEHVGRFVMQSSGDVVRFLHWGRPINFMGHGAARQESYGGDLQRMLVLAASDKDDTVGLTGKFGLGFKSVLLATDAPCILSGDLKIKIVGGCLPIKWEAAGGALDALLNVEPKVHGLRGTVVEFKLSEPLRQSEVLDRFASLAGLQCIFSKEIRSIQVNTETHHWSPTPLALDLQNIEIGSADLPFKGSLNRANLINFRTGSGCFALHLGSRGFIRFPVGAEHSPPAIWVTAPTRESAAQGLILNNEFELDTGRGGLPHGESAQSNLVLAEKMAMGAADLVHKATRRSRDNWEDTKSRLNLVDGVSPSEFWTTFWDQIPTRKQDDDNGESNRLLSHFGSCLLDRYLMIAAEIPNGLSGSLSKFVKAADVCLILNSRWEKLHAVLAAWPAFVSHYPMSGWISANVATQLKAATGNGGLNAVDMSVRLALDMVPEKRCSSDLIATLNDLFSELTLEEAEVVQDQMSGFEFQVKNGKDGNWNFGRNLLKSGGALDKQCLPFAPATHHLNPSYKGPSLKLLQDYAPFQQPQASTLASWILSAPPEPLAARIAGLKFLLGNPEVQLYVRIGLTGSWIDGLKPASVYLADFSIQEKNQIFGMFNAAPTWSEPVPELDESTPLDGQVALEAIRDWWRAEKETHLKKFYLHFWPSNIARRFESDADSRSSWMTLFAIGLMQRHGRTQDFQNRGFIDKMQSKGFWEVFCQTDPRQNGQAWLNVLNEYGEQQIEDEQYSMWMDNFPRLYRIARWFEVYVQVFQGLDYRKKSNVSGFLSPSADPEMSGSGIHAPTMRGSLRLGQHVVVRELLRSGALKGEAAISLAFKPGESVKQFLSGIGFPDLAEQATTSQKIHSVLVEHLGDDATFDGAYDIPLIILSRDPALQQKVLGDLVAFKGEFNGE
jgi:hypothetical protein